MKDKKTFMVRDENGIQTVAELLTILEIDNIEYAVYSIDTDDISSDVYVARIVKDLDGYDTIVSIEDELEKKKLFEIIDRMINES